MSGEELLFLIKLFYYFLMKEIVLATKNPGKILEYKQIFKELNLNLKLLTLKDFNINDDVVEDGKTFEENAVKKANFYFQLIELPVLSEDSGLEIDCLNGEPGVFSRRWPTSAEAMAGKPGSEKTDEELVKILFEKMRGIPKEKRGAQFRVVTAFKAFNDKSSILAEGILRGWITEKPTIKIIPGFPFRSLFYVDEIGKTLGDLTMEDESRVAHRRIAIAKLLPEFLKIF